MTINWRDYCSCLIIELFFFNLALSITVNFFPLYWLEIHQLHLDRLVNLSADAIMSDYLKIINYIQNPFINQLQLKFFKVSTAGQHHFYDVYRLMMLNYLSLIVFGVLSVLIGFKLLRSGRLWRILVPIKVMMVLFASIVTLGLVDFQNIFIAFHRMLFANQDWVFNPVRDPIINVLPISVFVNAFLLLVFLIVIFNGCLYYAGKQTFK